MNLQAYLPNQNIINKLICSAPRYALASVEHTENTWMWINILVQNLVKN